MASHRIAKVNELLKRQVGQILLKEFDSPEGTLVTVVRVEAFPNLQGAKVYISVIPEDKTKDVLGALQREIFDIQQILNERLRMRPVPKIHWVLEQSAPGAQRIEQLLEEIKKK